MFGSRWHGHHMKRNVHACILQRMIVVECRGVNTQVARSGNFGVKPEMLMIWSPSSIRGARECTRHVWQWVLWSYEKECTCFNKWLWWNGCEIQRNWQTVLESARYALPQFAPGLQPAWSFVTFCQQTGLGPYETVANMLGKSCWWKSIVRSSHIERWSWKL